MYKIFIETAALGEHPELLNAAGNPEEPGISEDVRLTLNGAAASADVTLSGSTGAVTLNGAAAGVAQAPDAGGDLTTPFANGTTAVIVLDPDPPLSLGAVERIEIGHASDTAAWFPVRVRVEDDTVGAVFEAPIGKWLTGTEKSVDLTLEADFTTPRDEVSTGDIERLELSRDLVSISPDHGVRFVFNDTVDRTTFDASRPGGRARSLSIRYMDDANDTNLTAEVSASGDDAVAGSVRTDWTEDDNGRITAPGRYLWESDDVLVIAPPVGGWPLGRFVRFEFDRSLNDDAGNQMRDDRDQVVVALVASDVKLTIDTPSKERTYLPWESNDQAEGKPEDFYVRVGGTVTQNGGREHIESITVTATNDNGDTVLSVGYTIPAGAAGRDELFDAAGAVRLASGTEEGVGTSWRPRADFGGTWAIHLPLQDPEFPGPGAQAVAEKRYKWRIEATVITAQGTRIPSSNFKIVYHEIYKPRVVRATVVLPDGEVHKVFDREDGTDELLRLNHKNVGSMNFILDLMGDFEDSGSFRSVNSYDPSATIQFLSADIRQSDDVPQGQEEADVTLPTFTLDDRAELLTPDGRTKNDTTHTLTFSAKTKARSPIVFHLGYEVDTIPLDLKSVEAVSLAFA